MELIPFGEDGWLIPTDDPIGLAALIDRTGLDDVVPGQRHVLLRGSQQRVMAAVAGVPEDRPVRAAREVRHLPAQWEGPDLRHVAETAGMSELAVIQALLDTTLTVAFCGFSPGFGYLTGLDERLHIPRRDRPRPQIPAGSIAIAAGYCAVYPTSSPGGWHLIGRCEALLFSADREPPALLSPGDRVRFV
ncbi:MAG: allophanate hydrolase subunit 1 [Actinobacteria bacterium]|nr:allophanate hydrolase subunit 1 [Actinomycetota bacterium]MCB8996606.1 allophanate hydrolase subunit 1 [Actinomycetota bacterium]MCB9415049.1 allophanate hydrolase subunit 1 [Actinomycetota bacterium]HRY10181.1 carboxyltransferase domain-containing protein [Candidatus Nanopelagicales bacterium]